MSCVCNKAMNAKLPSPSVIRGCRQTGLVKLRLHGDLHITVSRFTRHVAKCLVRNAETSPSIDLTFTLGIESTKFNSQTKGSCTLSVTIGTKLGSCEITALIGAGGMGEVYRARDLKLKRDVAVKLLPDEFSRDADWVSRFQREAELLASLNHPNIAAIYDLEEAGGSRYLVLELVEGETLLDHLKRGPLPTEEALSIAKSICDALEAAHEKGIIHRDLKPA